MNFLPALLQVIRDGYQRAWLVRDLTAGLIVGVVALPLSIALAIASGVRPEQGLYTAIVAGFLISALGGSRFQIGGPTGAFVVLVSETVRQYGYEGLALATLMAGVLLIVMGFAGLGAVIRYIPYPVTVGFTSGIALLIFSTQVPDFFGLTVESTSGQFVDKLIAYWQALPTASSPTVAIGLVALLITAVWPRISRRLPGSLVAILVTTAAVHYLGIPVETIGSKLGEVPNSLPQFRVPDIDFKTIQRLSSPAIAIALLAAIESLLSAVVADGMTGRKHNSDTELIGLGIANLASPLFGGIPATGAIARTATNIKNGARTPVAGIVHAVTLLAILLFVGKWAVLIPMTTLAAILVVVAYNMSEWHLFLRIFRSTRSDVAVLLATFGLTVMVDLTAAIQVGVVLACLLFMLRMSRVSRISSVTDTLTVPTPMADTSVDAASVASRRVPAGVEVFEIEGPFFFGAADRFRDALDEIRERPKVLILRMRYVPVMDSTGLRALEDIVRRTRKAHTVVVLASVKEQPLSVMERAGLIEVLGRDNLAGDIDAALQRANLVLGADKHA